VRSTKLRTFACICALGLLLPASAGAAARWSLKGAGWGHGIGMSQYGAFGYAKQGFTYREILQHYYTGTRIERRGASVVRVLLQANRSRVIFTGATRAGNRGLEEGSVYSAVRKGANVALRSPSGRTLETFADVLPISGGVTTRLLGRAGNGVNSGVYRGAIEIRTAAGPGLNAINTLGIEDYVQGVVPAESPAIWPGQALAAQAVAARTYALTTGVNGKGFDQYPDTRSQVYRGLGAETASTNTAVAATRGEVVTYGGRAVVTYFFSTSGGETENVENVFTNSEPKPWLKGVSDPFDNASPYHRWGPYTFSTRKLGAKLGGVVKGRFRKLKVLKRGVSPRVVRAKVVGSKGSTIVAGPLLRARLGLRDTWFYLRRISSKTDRAKARTSSGTRPLAGIYGRVESARERFVKLQKQVDGDWKTVEMVPLLGSEGSRSYKIHVGERGKYRVLAGWAPGPTVAVDP
jgi:stage II sporulation protein D